MQTLAEFSRQLAEVVEIAGRGTVAIASTKATVPGICWREGIVVAADHALPGPDAALEVTLPSGAATRGQIVGRDPGTDLAVIRLDAGALPPLPPSTGLRAGSLVLAVAPHGAAMGIVSSITENWRTWRGGHVEQLIRLDMGLAASLSGAAVVDAEARVVGLATRGLTRIGGVAIPAVTINRVVDAVLTRGRVARGYLGVGLQPVALPLHLNKGERALIVVSLEPDAPAEKGGVLLGDILTSIDGQPITDPRDVMSFLDADAPGKTLHLDVLRAGQAAHLEITVGEKE